MEYLEIFCKGLSDKLFRIHVKVQRGAIQEFFYFKKYKTLILFKFLTYLEKEIVWNKLNSRSGESSLDFFYLKYISKFCTWNGNGIKVKCDNKTEF